VIPQTIAALAAFLFLVAPGLTFELIRERRRPPVDETAFREASRVALASLVFTLLSLLILFIGQLLAPKLLPDPAVWVESGKAYIKKNYQLIAIAALLQFALSCGLAATAAVIIGRSSAARINPYSLWYLALRGWVKPKQQPLAMVVLNNDTTIFGQVRGYSTENERDNRELILGPPLFYQEEGDEETTDLSTDWTYVLIPASSMRYLAVDYWSRRDLKSK
jgi:Family of unknown function (DUF6338)